MKDEAYERLADALNGLPNGFPRTPSGVEVKILRKIYTQEEATVAGNLSGQFDPVEVIAERLKQPVDGISKQLFQMVRKGQVWMDKGEGNVRFRLAPFVVGVYEASLHLMDRELAQLTEEYFLNGGAVGIMQTQPALHRVVPAKKSVEPEWILPYDDVRAILISAKAFNVRECICRKQQDELGSRRCDFPLASCLNFSFSERTTPYPGDISREEALALLDRVEEIGLVHTVSNVIEGVGYVCNCCGCCCGILRGMTDWGLERTVAYANYQASIDPEICSNCGTCIERCQVKAIFEGDGFSVVHTEKCIGCGLCVTGCETGAATLTRKPEEEIIRPPATFANWEQERLRNRGMN